MHSIARMLEVKGGNVRYDCRRCGRTQYIAISSGVIEKSVRCMCGLSEFIGIERRKTKRNSVSRCAYIILKDGWQATVYVCDTSSGGVGFNLPNQSGAPLSLNEEITIAFPSLSGGTVERSLKIKNISNSRVGAQFLHQLVN